MVVRIGSEIRLMSVYGYLHPVGKPDTECVIRFVKPRSRQIEAKVSNMILNTHII